MYNLCIVLSYMIIHLCINKYKNLKPTKSLACNVSIFAVIKQ